MATSWQTILTRNIALRMFLCLSILSQTIVSAQTTNHTVEEAYQVLGISPNPDGSFTREIRIPMVNATPEVNSENPNPKALSKDITIFSTTNKSCVVRLYRPLNPPKNTKLPLIIYVHGGDFVLFSATTVIFHNFCEDIASQFPAVVVSVEHRLAPEHRLPAAYDDAMNVIFWVKHQELGVYGRDPWLHDQVDFSRVFLLGSASGGNIVYHAALRALDFDLSPMKIKGVIMNQPFFGGVIRTESEIRLIEDNFVPLYVADVLWTLALPKNASRDHPFCNPISGGTFKGRVKRLPRCMVKGDSGDPLVDRGKILVKLLKSNGVSVVSMFVEGGYHGVELSNSTAAQQLYDAIKDFIQTTL